MQAYRAWLRTGLIGVISAVLVACATAPAPRPDHEPAPALAADDLALVERMQAEYALQGGDREAAAERLAKAAMLSEDPDQSLSALQAAPQNSPQINAALDKAQAQWAFSRAGFQLSAESRYVPTLITTTTETLLRQMQELTSAYTQLLAAQS